MRKTEIILTIVTLLAIILRLLSIEGGVLLSAFSFSIFSLFYLFLGVLLLNKRPIIKAFKKDTYKGLGWRRILFSVGVSISLSITLMGILFALNKWAGATLVLGTGMTLLLVTSAVSLIRYVSKPSGFHISILIRCGTLGVVGMLLLLL